MRERRKLIIGEDFKWFLNKKLKHINNLINKSNFFTYETYIFDFDGTLVLSNEIKREGFFISVKNFEYGSEIINDILRSDTRIDRYFIFKKFSEIICKEKTKQVSIYEKCLKNYGDYTLKKIIELKPIQGSVELLNKLKIIKKKLYINSATPSTYLELILKNRNLNIYFNKIFGMEGNKLENLKKIKEDSKTLKNKIIMIGDGKDDLKAANEFNIKFYPVGINLTGTFPNFKSLI